MKVKTPRELLSQIKPNRLKELFSGVKSTVKAKIHPSKEASKCNQSIEETVAEIEKAVAAEIKAEEHQPEFQAVPMAEQSAQLKSGQILKRMKSNVTRQIVLAALTVVLVVTLIFAMSLSWYTNVSTTNDMQLQTEAWGFEADNISISTMSGKMAPNRNYTVPLSVDNSSGTNAVRALVTVDKSGKDEDGKLYVDEEMQKRIYFYVDTTKTYTFADGSDSETVSRVYIGEDEGTESYLYTIAAGEKLVMSDEYSSDAALRCEWVKDLEGYYFRGKVSGDTVTAEEYIRPVTYEYDNAVFDEGNALVKIGDKTTAEFLASLTKDDGYKGSIELKNDEVSSSDYVKVQATHEVQDADGNKVNKDCTHYYYKIDIDENGSGVWLYLCCKAEIEEATSYDSALNNMLTDDNNSNVPAISPVVNVTASAVEQVYTNISRASELVSLINDQESGTTLALSLTNDITLNEPITLTAGKTLQLDLNNYAIDFKYVSSSDSRYAAFTVEDGAKLVLLNGEIRGTDNDSSLEGLGKIRSVGIECMGGEAAISSVTITNVNTAVMVYDWESNSESVSDSTVRITACRFDTSATAVALWGNGSQTETLSRMVIQDTNIKSGYIGISGQGTNTEKEQFWGTELTLIKSTVEGYWTAIYQPQQQSTTTITDCTITGNTGIIAKGGTMTIYSSEITGTGEHKTEDAGDSSGSFKDTGDGVYVEANYGWRVNVVLRGKNKVISNKAYAVELFGVSGKGPGSITVEGSTSLNGGKSTSHTNDIGTLTLQELTETEKAELSKATIPEA